jgi:uncharacterized integral membrane protein
MREDTMVFVYVLIGLLGAVALVFTVQNPDPVTIAFLNWRTTPLPLSLLLLLSAFVGVVCAAVSGFAQQFQLKRKIRRLETRLAVLSRELDSPLREPVRIDSVRGQSPNSSVASPVARSRIM